MKATAAAWRRTAFAVAKRPDLWCTAVRQGLELRPRGWRPPQIPLPDPAYLQFRSITQYGDAQHVPVPGDVVSYLAWCKAWRQSVTTRR
jgi:hypothetical protein